MSAHPANTQNYALCVGEALIDFIPGASGPNDALCYQPHPGGAVANVAVALARLGGAARFVGKLAEDAFGDLLLRTLQENQVDTRYVPITQQGNTTLALVTLQADGQRDFRFYRQQTADTLLETSDLDDRAWENVTICHAGSVLLATEPARSATQAALEQAHQRGLLVSFDVNARPALWQSERGMRELLVGVSARADLLKFSAEEAHYLDSTLNEPLDPANNQQLQELARKLLVLGPALVIITRGALGAMLCTQRQTIESAASTHPVIDTTGAGDAFMGAVLYQLIEQGWTDAPHLAALTAENLQGLGDFANAAAGLSCTRYGGIASLPYLHEIFQK